MNTPQPPASAGTPQRNLSLVSVISVCVGMVIGAGIFKAPASVAANVGSSDALFLAWTLGGVFSLLGALCYAELSTAFPSAGGDYHFLDRAYGRHASFLFAWSRFAVINTGSIAIQAFVLGDYANAVLPLGPRGADIYALIAVVVLTAINLRGMRSGVDAQMGLTVALLAGLLVTAVAGACLVWQGVPAANPAPVTHDSLAGFGVAMVFVLLAFGGWSEISTLSAEIRNPQRGMLIALVASLAIITAVYLLVNWAFWRGLGLGGMAGTRAPAATLLEQVFGRGSAIVIGVVVVAAIVTSINATIIVGARTTFAAARDWSAFRNLGRWDDARDVPVVAVWAQSGVALALLCLGALSRDGFSTLVDYTAPVYWAFFCLSGFAVIRLRRLLPHAPRPFRTPFYPWVPLAFCLSSLYTLYSSLAYVRVGAVAGVAVLLSGGVVLGWLERHRVRSAAE